jgi:hypothetical protein
VTILPGLQRAVREGSERLMRAALDEAVRLTAEASPPPVSGDLSRSIMADDPAGDTVLTARLRATAMHASWTDEGTGEWIGRPRLSANGDYPLRFYWGSFNAVNGPGYYAFWSVKGQEGQKWWITHHPERWQQALEYASRTGAFGAG